MSVYTDGYIMMDLLVFSLLTIAAIIGCEIKTYFNIRKEWKEYEEQNVFCTLTDCSDRTQRGDPGKERGAKNALGDSGPCTDRLHDS